MSELEGTDFGGALDNLRQVSRVWLPRMAMSYSAAAGDLAATLDGEPGKYERPDMFRTTFGWERTFQTPNVDPVPGEPASPMAIWMELRNILQAAFAESANNYAEVGEALADAVDSFAKQDDAARDELETLRSEMEDSSHSVEGKDKFEDDKADDLESNEEVDEDYHTEQDVPDFNDPRDAPQEQ